MFSVPGWSVLADSLVTQKSSKESRQTDDDGTRKGKKRKRDGETVVTADNLEKMWKRHFDLENGQDGQRDRKKRRKREKHDLETGEHKATERTTGIVNGHGTHGIKEPSRDRVSKTLATTESKDQRKRKTDRIARKLQPVNQVSNSTIQPSPVYNPQEDRIKKKRKGIKKDRTGPQDTDASMSTARPLQDAVPAKQPPAISPSSLTPLQQTMRSRLIAARFRHLNETLYTTPSSKALSLFSSSPELFADYHAGFALQVKDSWPENPVDIYISNVRSRAKIPFKLGGRNDSVERASATLPLPRRPNGACSIADLGCGDAKLSQTLQPRAKKLQLRFQNFDLRSQSPAVTMADISALPLKDGEIDVAVFCLSLMGTNWIEFIEEAWRVLRGDGRGECWVSEVKSRFGRVKSTAGAASTSKRREKQNKKKEVQQGSDEARDEIPPEEIYAEDDHTLGSADQTDISAFVDVFQTRGFMLRQDSVERRNKMFVSMVFVKTGVPSRGKWKGMKWTGSKYERVSTEVGAKKRFVEDGGDFGLSVEQEGRVLKPCVYKLR